MKISLNAETAQRIRDTLGEDIDLAPELVPNVLARLAVEAPSVYSDVLGELSGSQIRLDSEEELRRRRRRGMLRRLLFSWGEYESGVGDRLLEKRHIAAAVPLALAVLTMTLLAFSMMFGHHAGVPAVPGAIVHRSPRAVVRQGTPIPAIGAPSLDIGPRDKVTAAAPPSSGAVGRLSFAGLPPVPMLPPGMSGLPDSSGPGTRGLGNPVVVSARDNVTPEKGARGPLGPAVVSPVVYNRTSDIESSRHETSDHPADGDGSKIVGSSRMAQALVAGTRLRATLLTGALVIAGGSPVPVVIETAEPHGIWMGQAVLGPGDRVQVTLALSGQNRMDGIRGIALDAEHLMPGLPGRTTVRHSSAATAVATAALQAASDYAQAVARQGSISVFDGLSSIAIGGQVPEPWTYLAARVAREFQARATPGGWVTAIEVPAGAEFILLITGAS